MIDRGREHPPRIALVLESLIGALTIAMLAPIGCDSKEPPVTPAAATAPSVEADALTVSMQPVSASAAPAPGTIHVLSLPADVLPLPWRLGEDKWTTAGCAIVVPGSGYLTIDTLGSDGQHGTTSWIADPGRVVVAFGVAEVTGAESVAWLEPILDLNEQRTFHETFPDLEQRAFFRTVLVSGPDAGQINSSERVRTVMSGTLRVPYKGSRLAVGTRSSGHETAVVEAGQEFVVATWVVMPPASVAGMSSFSLDVNRRRYEIIAGGKRYRSLADYPHPFVELVIRWDEGDAPVESE